MCQLEVPVGLQRACVQVALAALIAACGGGADPQSVCDEYARTFADIAANTCRRGSFDSNVAAFKASARVGSSCELVGAVRDLEALRGTCFGWLRNDLPADCSLLDDPDKYVAALPEACKAQLDVSQ